MNLTAELIPQLQRARTSARVALAAEAADRVVPIYEESWVGTYYESVRQSVDLAWRHARGEHVDEGEKQRCVEEVQILFDFYRDEEIDLLVKVVTTVAYLLESLTADEAKSSMAVARTLLSARDAAQSAEGEADANLPQGTRGELALSEEKAWQASALALAQRWQHAPDRKMFEPLDDKPPKWLVDWRQRRPR